MYFRGFAKRGNRRYRQLCVSCGGDRPVPGGFLYQRWFFPRSDPKHRGRALMTLPVRHQCSPSGLMTAAADFSTNVENGRETGREKWSQKWSRKSYGYTLQTDFEGGNKLSQKCRIFDQKISVARTLKLKDTAQERHHNSFPGPRGSQIKLPLGLFSRSRSR